MVTKFLIKEADFDDNTAWSLSYDGPNDTTAPGPGDYALLVWRQATVARPAACHAIDVLDSGTLLIGADITLDDAPGAMLRIKSNAAGCRMTAQGAVVRSASPVPANPWDMAIEPLEADGRNIDLDGLECLGIAPRLAWSGGALLFNDTSAADARLTLTAVTPKVRTPALDYHRIAGRNAGGRTFRRGNDSARASASGFCRDSAKNRARLESLKDVSVVSFSSWRSHLSRGYVEDVRTRQPAGSMYLYFDIHLVEDL